MLDSPNKSAGTSPPVKAFCSDCGAEVETEDSPNGLTESYDCPKCGAKGTVRRKLGGSAQPAERGLPSAPSLSLNVLDILKLNLGGTRSCGRCGTHFPASDDVCPSCAHPVTSH